MHDDVGLGRIEINVEVRSGVETERLHRAVQVGGDLWAMGPVVGDQQLPARFDRRQELRKLAKRLDDRIEGAIHVKVIFLDVINQGDHRAVVEEGAIELAGFGDEDAGPGGQWVVAGDDR